MLATPAGPMGPPASTSHLDVQGQCLEPYAGHVPIDHICDASLTDVPLGEYQRDPDPFRDLLVRQLTDLRQLLTKSHQSAMDILDRHGRDASRLECAVYGLRAENQNLRACLAVKPVDAASASPSGGLLDPIAYDVGFGEAAAPEPPRPRSAPSSTFFPFLTNKPTNGQQYMCAIQPIRPKSQNSEAPLPPPGLPTEMPLPPGRPPAELPGGVEDDGFAPVLFGGSGPFAPQHVPDAAAGSQLWSARPEATSHSVSTTHNPPSRPASGHSKNSGRPLAGFATAADDGRDAAGKWQQTAPLPAPLQPVPQEERTSPKPRLSTVSSAPSKPASKRNSHVGMKEFWDTMDTNPGFGQAPIGVNGTSGMPGGKLARFESEAHEVPAVPTADVGERSERLSQIHDEHERSIRDSVIKRQRAKTNCGVGGFEVLTAWEGDPSKFAGRGLLTPKREGEEMQSTRSVLSRSMTLPRNKDEDDEEGGEDRKKPRCKIVNPNSPWRSAWDLLSLLLVVYDMAAIPFELFDPPKNVAQMIVDWNTRIFWTLDMPGTIFTGYVTADGFIEMRLGKSFKRYAKTWLVLDASLVAIDWMEVLLKAAGGVLGFARLGKASRTFRILRMIRLLRLVRMKEVFALFTERINSEKLIILADIVKQMVIIIGMAHFIACVWYGIGNDQKTSWITESGFDKRALGDRYAMSLHWSLSQFAGGMDEVTPEHITERLFAIVVFLLAFVVASIFVSSLTSSMTQLNIIGSQQAQMISVLRRYLQQNHIPSKLSMRVQRNAQHAMQEQQRFMPEKTVSILSVVSEPLRVEIHLHMYSPVFAVHPFFQRYLEECPQVMRKVCHHASVMSLVSSGDILFSTGEMPGHPKMYFICTGTMQYHLLDGEIKEIHEDSWVSEAVLWTSWMHRGHLVAGSDCRLCVLDARQFQEISCQFEHAEFDPKAYAAEFVEHLNQLEDPNDLPMDIQDCVGALGRRKSADTFAKGKKFAGIANIFGYGKLTEGIKKVRHKATKTFCQDKEADDSS